MPLGHWVDLVLNELGNHNNLAINLRLYTMLKNIIIVFALFITSFHTFADRYIEDEVGGGSDKFLIYLILIIVGWLAISFLTDMIKDAIKQTKEEINSGRLPLKTEIRKQINLRIQYEIKTFPLTIEDYLLNFYVYGLGFVMGGIFGAIDNPNDMSITNIISGALLFGVPSCFIMYISFGRGVSKANKDKIKEKYSKYDKLPDDIEQLKKIRDQFLNK